MCCAFESHGENTDGTRMVRILALNLYFAFPYPCFIRVNPWPCFAGKDSYSRPKYRSNCSLV